MNVWYFGAWGGPGHYMWTPTRGSPGGARDLEKLIDGNLAPQFPGKTADARSTDPEPEGLATVSHLNGMTIVAFWDRSQDARYGSNSAFIVEGEHSFDEVIAAAREQFPTIWKRFTFEVREQ